MRNSLIHKYEGYSRIATAGCQQPAIALKL